LHGSYAERAARAGVHVLVEKPLALSEAEGRAVIAACREAGVHQMVAYRLHLHPAFLKAVELARGVRLGDPRVFTSLFVQPIPAGHVRLKAGAGPLDFIGVYCVNAARHLFGAEPEEVVVVKTGQGRGRFRESEEAATAILRFPEGRVASFTCGHDSQYRAEFRLTGTAGDFLLDRAYGMKGDMAGVLTVEGKAERFSFAANDQFGAELDYFSRCILAGDEPQPSGEEGLADLHILAALHDSARLGQVIKVWPVPPPARPDPANAVNLPPSAEPELIKVTAPFSQFK
jgi:predicted dehydrogenase